MEEIKERSTQAQHDLHRISHTWHTMHGQDDLQEIKARICQLALCHASIIKFASSIEDSVGRVDGIVDAAVKERARLRDARFVRALVGPFLLDRLGEPGLVRYIVEAIMRENI